MMTPEALQIYFAWRDALAAGFTHFAASLETLLRREIEKTHRSHTP